MPRIQVLPPETVEKIAAGEVVERPASVLKELLENSLDSGAGKINISFEQAGRSLLRINDDGCGMSPEDLETSVVRHATSKIRVFDDLDYLATFGFRGEALYSIAAVSRLTITSCEHGKDSRGARIGLEGCKILLRQEAPPIPGTTLEVRDLFFNVPARAKFLKSDATERSHLLRVAEECMLANPAVAFSVNADGNAVYVETAVQPDERGLRVRSSAVLGAAVANGSLYTDDKSSGLRGLFSSPQGLVATRNLQYYFVNKRPVQSKTLSQAVYKAYEKYRGNRHAHPACVLFLELPPADFDVNIHPQKRDVRFKDEGAVFHKVYALLDRLLSAAAKPPSIFAGTETKPAGNDGFVQPRQLQKSPVIRISEPVQIALHDMAALMDSQAPKHSAGMVRDSAEECVLPEVPKIPQDPEWWRPPYRYIGQMDNSYLLFEYGDGLALLDQHAAQERVIFEEYMRQLSSGMPVVQQLLIPMTVELSPSQAQALLDWREWLCSAGFEVEPAGPAAFLVRSVPSIFRFTDETVISFLTGLAGVIGDPQRCAEDIKRETVALMACKKAVKAGDKLSEEEALRLLSDVKACRDGMSCPHGRPTMITVERGELARRFKRPRAAGM